MIEIKATPKFMRLAKKIMSLDSLQRLIDTLAINPKQGALLKNTNGLRKIRWETGKGVGKRGGLRVLYYWNGRRVILLITMFKKSDQENIDAGEKAEIRKLINEFLEQI